MLKPRQSPFDEIAHNLRAEFKLSGNCLLDITLDLVLYGPDKSWGHLKSQ